MPRPHLTSRPRHARAGALLGLFAGAVVLSACERHPGGGALDAFATIGEPGASPGQFSYPRAIDSDGPTIWVIDKLARVQRLDAASGRALSGWRMPQWQQGKPTGVTVWSAPGSPDEFVLIPDTHYHRVCIYKVPRDPGSARAEALVAQFGEYGTGPGQFTYVTDVAVVPNAKGDGIARLYVSEYGGNDRISIFERATPDAPGAEGDYRFVSAFGHFGIAGEKPDGPGMEPVFSRPQSIAFDWSTRELIVTDACNHRVGRLTLEGKVVAWIGKLGQAGAPVTPGQDATFVNPYGLALPGDGTAIVAEFGASRLQRIDLATGRSLGVYGRPGRGPGEVATPWGIALDAGRAFALDSGNNRVLVFDLPRAPRLPAREGGRS